MSSTFHGRPLVTSLLHLALAAAALVAIHAAVLSRVILYRGNPRPLVIQSLLVGLSLASDHNGNLTS